ncbi:MAG: tetratricopeptide repeat protein [Chitinivibrionia bacterium]|nr:tetratricopeptide repeat protein [Chitinivibrionia bacterium]
MKKNITIILALIFVISASFSQIVDKNELFAEANKLYEEKNYDSASVLYLQILQNYGKNSAIFYNIANCAYRNGDVGAAILFLERAKLLSPNDDDISANFDFLRKQTIDKFEKTEESFTEQAFNGFQNLMTLETQIITILIFSFFIVLILGFTLFSAKRRTLKIYAIMILFIFSLIQGISANIKYSEQKNNIRCVVMTETLNAVNEPKGNTVIFAAHEGTVLNVVKTSDDWYFVSLPNGASGWVQKQFVEII